MSKTSTPNPPKLNAKPLPKSYAQIVSGNTSQNALEKTWIEIRHEKQKNSSSAIQKMKSEMRRIIFQRANMSSQKSEADLMLVLNKA